MYRQFAGKKKKKVAIENLKLSSETKPNYMKSHIQPTRTGSNHNDEETTNQYEHLLVRFYNYSPTAQGSKNFPFVPSFLYYKYTHTYAGCTGHAAALNFLQPDLAIARAPLTHPWLLPLEEEAFLFWLL